MYQSPESPSPRIRLKTPTKMSDDGEEVTRGACDPRGLRLAQPSPEGAAQQPAPVQGEGRNQVEEREDQVDQGKVRRHSGDRWPHEPQRGTEVEKACEGQAHRRSGGGGPDLGPAVPGVLFELCDASEDEQGDRPGPDSVAARDHSVPQLVKQDRDEEEQ